MGSVPQQLATLDPGARRVACLCHHGMRSLRVAAFLEHHGFARVANITVGAATLWGTSLAATKAALVVLPPTQLACLRFLIGALLLGLLSLAGGRRPGSFPACAHGPPGADRCHALLRHAERRVAARARRRRHGDPGRRYPPCLQHPGDRLSAERLGRLQVAGLVCSLAGMALVGSMMNGEGAHSALGLILLLAAVMSGAIYATLGRRAYQEANLMPILSRLRDLARSSSRWLWWEARSTGLPILTAHSVGLLVYLGAGCSALGFALWAFGLRPPHRRPECTGQQPGAADWPGCGRHAGRASAGRRAGRRPARRRGRHARRGAVATAQGACNYTLTAASRWVARSRRACTALLLRTG